MIFIVIFFTVPCALAKDTITWLQPDFPPYVIVSGNDKAKGIDNRIVQYVIDHLPDYNHSFKVAGYKRILANLKKEKKAVVAPLFITPERQKYLVYSNVANYLPLPNGLVINKDDLARFEPYMSPRRTIDIEAVILSEQFIIGIASGRSYSGIIDDMIRKYKPSRAFYERHGPDHIGLLVMLDSKRIHAAFGFPVEVQYLSKKIGLKNNLIVLQVEKMEPYAPVYFAAPKNQWGQALMTKINKIINQKGVVDRFNEYYEYWLDDDIRKYYRKIVKQHYRQ